MAPLNHSFKKLKNFLFVFTVFIANNVISQDHVLPVPNNGKVITIYNWLVTEPMADNYFQNEGDSVKIFGAYSKDFLVNIGGERSPRIKKSKKFKTPNGKENSFTFHSWSTEYINLINIFGKSSDVFTYLYAELESETDQDLFLHIGTNDAGKVWVNGDLIIEHKNGRVAQPSQNIERIHLNKGKNSILLKIDQIAGGWGAYVQIYSLKEQKLYDSRFKSMYSQSTKNATIIETKVIFKQKNRYIGWPSLFKTKSGELLAVFSGNRDEHVCPYGITQMIRSRDNGKTWTKPITINNTPLDDRDAGILETKSGTWVVNWFTSMAFDNERVYAQHPEYKRHREKLDQQTIDYWLGNWTRRSVDKGKTWQEPVKQLVSAPHGPIELKNGKLLYVGTSVINGNKRLSVEESVNDGNFWDHIATIPIPEDESIVAFSEPHVVELSDGKLIAMFRYNPKDASNSFLWQSESLDGGKIWTTAHKTGIWGYPPHLIKLKNDWLLLSYGVRKIPYGERVCISKDGGETWDIDNEIILSTSESGDLGYPASIQLDDGSILTIFYQIDKDGEKTSLMQTHWKLKGMN